MAFFLLIGFLVAGLLKFLIPDNWIGTFAGKNKLSSDIKLSIFGVPLPLCSCGVIPTGISLYKSGASRSATTSFFISTPQTRLDSIMVTYSLMGLPFALVRPIVAFLTGVLGGTFVRLFDKENIIKDEIELAKKKEKNVPSEKISFKDSMRYAFVDFLDDISKWLSIGLLIAALLAVLIPNDFFAEYLNNPFLEMGVILLASVPLYVCATGSVPIAAVLLLKGISPGAALVFLMAGPATNAATIALIKHVFGKRTFIAYLSAIVGGAVAAGLIINYFLPSEWFSVANIVNKHVHVIPHWLQMLSGLIFILLIIGSFYRKYFSKKFKKEEINQVKLNINDMEKIVSVEGMTCNHCKMNVEKAAQKIEGIEKAEVDLQSGTLKVDGGNINLEELGKTINDLGYVYKGEK